MTEVPIASISVNLCNRWAYLKARGDSAWKWFPTYLPVVVPRMLKFLEDRELRATFFLVGQDAAMKEHRALFQAIVAAGHEVGNHSFQHEPWLHRYLPSELEYEIVRAEEQLHEFYSKTIQGFRGPAFSISNGLLDVLAQRGYTYDASILPSFTGPLTRACFLRGATLSPEQQKERHHLFGTWRSGLRPLSPFLWRLGGRKLLELPLTTMPGLRLPMDLSSLRGLSGDSNAVAGAYFRGALATCSAASMEPSFLLRPLDFLGPEEAPELNFVPSLRSSLEQKLQLADRVVGMMKARYRLVCLDEHARAVSKRGDLLRIAPNHQLP